MSVCAVVLTFQPELAQLRESFLALRSQVEALVIIDNASREGVREALRLLTSEFSGSYLQNETNLGVATGLNQGIRCAEELGVDFVLLFDQDSLVNDGFVASQLKCLNDTLFTQQVGLVSPVVVNRMSGREWHPLPDAHGKPLLAQTSGSLMPLQVFREVGYFADHLFIDYVDYEHCFRMRLAGWNIVEANEARLEHMPGANLPVRRFGRIFYTINASPLRQYYRMRNMVWTILRYRNNFPATCWMFLRSSLREYLKIFLLEDRRWAKVKGSAAGLRDGLSRHMGKKVEAPLSQRRRIKYPVSSPRV